MIIDGKMFKTISIKTIEPVFRTKPEETCFVLGARKYRVVGEPVFYLVMAEKVRLGLDLSRREDKSYKQRNSTGSM